MQWLVDLLLKLFGLWLAKTPAPIAEAEKAGAATQQVQNLEKANADTRAALQAADAVRAADAADPGRLRDPSDPDCRDCRVQ
jgi:hypothetical protein